VGRVRQRFRLPPMAAPRRHGLASGRCSGGAAAVGAVCSRQAAAFRGTERPETDVRIRLGLFDDHDIVRAGFRYILSQHSDIDIVAEGATGREALAAIRAPPLDVCLIDLSLPDLSGIDVLRQAKGNKPDLAILILSAYSEEQYGLNVLKAGA